MKLARCLLAIHAAVVLFSLVSTSQAQRLEVPRRHDRPPGPPLSPEEAVAKMTVPEGFSVEIVAAEPDVVNPVGMFIDEKGRFWITESFEYPRKEPGPGRDRIKVLEDTDGDGKVDKTTIFAEGLNIPSGIAVGYGGVWVANSPDILFMQDTDGDLKADKIETVVTGFGRTDTHELPNSLTWGPDGWLYGLNGVFNYCDVRYAKENPNYRDDHPGWKFTCAMFRIHPRTQEFEIFAEGTSNPWGIAINDTGDFFISACVIDHLWHIVESAYYIRQGGPYPPHTWPMRSIVDHKHQKAAYCGITWFDSDAYPEEYRNVLYMGNIHGGCINADIVERSGATFKGKPHPGFPAKKDAWKDDEYDSIAKTGDPDNPKLADFLTANDPWFMPVVQKTGPDGCLYILDWYDRYHCYQDANADPEGIERSKGRLYRVRYKDTPHAQPFDLANKSDEELIGLLKHPNAYYRETAQRLLGERLTADSPAVSTIRTQALDGNANENLRLHSLWALAGIPDALTDETLELLVKDSNPVISSWGIRLAGDREKEWPGTVEMVSQEWLNPKDAGPFTGDQFTGLDPRVLLQLSIATGKAEGDDFLVPHAFTQFIPLMGIQDAAVDEPLITHVIWQNILNVANNDHAGASVLLQAINVKNGHVAFNAEWLSRAVDLYLDVPFSVDTVLAQVSYALKDKTHNHVARSVLFGLSKRLRERNLSNEETTALRKGLAPHVVSSITEKGSFESELTMLGATVAVPEAIGRIRKTFRDTPDQEARIVALETLVAAKDEQAMPMIRDVLSSKETDKNFRISVIEVLGRMNSPAVAATLLEDFDSLDNDVRPKAIEILTQRPFWSKALLASIAKEEISKDALNLNQLRRVANFKDKDLQDQFQKLYGTIREGRNPNREQVFYKMRDFLNGSPGDPHQGVAVFKKVCAQCHKMYGEGAEVGPDITRNGRNNWDQLLQNVFDPSAVIGPGYQARMLATTDGRVLTGLPVEESDERVVLKIQGGKIETIPRDQIEAYKVSELSMMPEELEKLVTPQELADLFAYLALDKPPTDPEAKILPGAPTPKAR